MIGAIHYPPGARTRLISEDQVDSGGRNSCSCLDNITCLSLAVIVGAVLLLLEAIIILLTLAYPGSVGIAHEGFLTTAQRRVLGAATVVMMLEAIIIGAVDVCKCLSQWTADHD